MARKSRDGMNVPKEKRWRSAKPQRDVTDSLQDLRDLCFKPPEDPNEPHLAKEGGTATAASALVALEALYDDERMNSRGTHYNFQDVTDVVKSALGHMYAMMENPDRHLYVPHFENDPPPRNPNIGLLRVLETLESAVMRDFEPEVKELRARLAAKSGHNL